jgi:hypothetical protein
MISEKDPVPEQSVLSEIEVERYLAREFFPQIRWYEQEAATLERRLARWTWAGISLGVLATILAAWPDSLLQVVFDDRLGTAREVTKWLVVITTAVASTANGVLVPRYRRMAISREKGRVKTTLQAKLAEIELSMVPMTGGERTQWLIHAARKLMDVEAEHGGAVHSAAASDSSAGTAS